MHHPGQGVHRLTIQHQVQSHLHSSQQDTSLPRFDTAKG